VELAIKILVELKEKLEPVNWKGVHLIIAGVLLYLFGNFNFL
jgi:uncharacterized membrane protein